MSNRKLLHPEVQRGFYENFRTLREVQEAAVKPILAGKNVVACSGTGSGKTEAAIAPLVSKYWKEFDKIDSSLIIYIAPTKALVNDLDKRLRPRMELIGLRLGIRHGDKDDVRRRKKLPHVIITTPESLDVMLFRGDKAIETVKAMVIDEVHLLYNTQRGLHLAILIDRLRKIVQGEKLQLVALSATIAKLKDVGTFFFGSDEDLVTLEYPSDREIEAEVRPGDYVNVVLERTRESECKLLAFANSRNACEDLLKGLSEANHLRGAIFTHYSNLAPKIRQEVEAKFASLKTAVCNATSTLELGIDIGDIDRVLLCDVPSSTDSFLQRIGRGNRRLNKTVAICFVGLNGEDLEICRTDALRYLALIGAARKGELSSRGTYELFGAIAQQCLSVIAARKEFVSIKSLLSTFEKVRYLDRPTLELIVNELMDRGYLKRDGIRNMYGPAGELHKLVNAMRIYGNFPVKAQEVKLFHGDKELGDVPLFNFGRTIGLGSYVIFKAEKWKILKITPRDLPQFVDVEPYTGKEECETFQYKGRGIGFETFLNEKMWEMIHGEDFPGNLLVGEELRETVTDARESVRSMCKIDEIPYCFLGGRPKEVKFRYFTFGGKLVNRAVRLITDPEGKEGDLWLDVHSRIDWKKLPTNPEDYESIFEKMFRQSPDQSIFQLRLPLDLQIREYTQEWLKDDAVRRVLSRLASSTPVEVSLEEWPFP